MKSDAQDGQENGPKGAENSRKPGPLRYLPPTVEAWSVRERLALATAVTQDNDKNWVAIGKLVKPFATEKRPEDYFAPRNCARQYASLLEKIEQPKRRGETAIHDCTPEEMLVKHLTLDRIEELNRTVNRIEKECKKLKKEIEDIENGSIDGRHLLKMYNELKDQEKQNAPKEELIPVSESDINRLQSDTATSSVPAPDAVNSSLPNNDVISSTDLGIPAEDGYEDGSARIEESHREVLRAISGTKTEIKVEVDDDESGDNSRLDSPPEIQVASKEIEPVTKVVEIKQEDRTEGNPQPAETASRKSNAPVEELAPAQSPSSSSVSSTPRRTAVPPPASSDAEADAEDDDVDDEATEGEEDEEESKSSLPMNEKSYRTWKKSINMIIRAAQSHKHASVFLSPVTDDIAAGYSQVINRPMDLSTIKRRVDNGEIRTTAEFQRDVMLMFTNAVMYNNAEHDVHKMALEMYDDVMYHIEQYLSTQVMSPSIESKVLRRRVSDHTEEEGGGRRRRGSADSDAKRDEPPKKSRK